MKKTALALAILTASLLGSTAAHASTPKATAATAQVLTADVADQDPAVQRPWAAGCHDGRFFKLSINSSGHVTGSYTGAECPPEAGDFIAWY